MREIGYRRWFDEGGSDPLEGIGEMGLRRGPFEAEDPGAGRGAPDSGALVGEAMELEILSAQCFACSGESLVVFFEPLFVRTYSFFRPPYFLNFVTAFVRTIFFRCDASLDGGD